MIGSQPVRLPMIVGKSTKKEEATLLKRLSKAMQLSMYLASILLTLTAATLEYWSYQQVNQATLSLDTSLDKVSRVTSSLTENQKDSIKCISLPQGYILVKIN